ncbi:MAG: DUF1565 domain-containing protein [Fibrobacter sp.]|nr:DUF1565 domain-containing protein [Fibrobacter sp.]
MKGIKFLAALAIVAGAATSVQAADLYVSLNTGANGNDGSKSAPYKNLWKALKQAKAGDVIHVAQGIYPGQTKRGWFDVTEPVSIIGGYSDDFSQRDPIKFVTKLQPMNENNSDQASGKGILSLSFENKKGVDMVIDGLTIDEGHSNTYHAEKGKPEGFSLGKLLPSAPAKGFTIDNTTKEANSSREVALIYLRGVYNTGNLTIQNCTFANGDNFGILGGWPEGKVRVINNVFVNTRMVAIDISGAKADQFNKSTANIANLEVANNTILFTWTRTSEMVDMGYGVRCNAKFNCNFHDNIVGLSVFSGLDMTKGDDKTKDIKIDNNLFFLNKRGDLSFTISPSIKFIGVDEFEDIEGEPGYNSMQGNISLKDVKAFGSKINKNYLENFLVASYTEKTDFDPNSPANLFRSAMGMNQVGTIQSTETMYANHYPVEEMYQLFGAMPKYGAQLPTGTK